MSLATDRLNKALKASPALAAIMVIENNPEAVRYRLKTIYGHVVGTNDPGQIYEAVQYEVNQAGANARKVLEDLLYVPIKEESLDEVQQDLVTTRLQQPPGELRSGPFIPPPDVDFGPEGSTSSSNVNEGGSGSFNWAGVISGLMPGILSAFGVTTNQPGQQAPAAQRNNDTWIWLLIIVAVIILAAIALK